MIELQNHKHAYFFLFIISSYNSWLPIGLAIKNKDTLFDLLCVATPSLFQGNFDGQQIFAKQMAKYSPMESMKEAKKGQIMVIAYFPCLSDADPITSELP